MNDRFDGDGVEGREEELRGVDELFAAAKEYASSARFRELMEFTGRFKKFAPYNAMLIYLQQPGAQFVLSARDWLHKFDRVVLADKRPIFILAPNGPLRCLFDVTDTQLRPGSSFEPFPAELAQPFEGDFSQPVPLGMLDALINCLAALGICYGTMRTGENYAGKIEVGGEGDPDVSIPVGVDQFILWRPAYSIRVSDNASTTAKFCAILHELGHLFCRHLPDAYAGKWKMRQISHETEEFEAESVAWLVARRQGVDNPSERYLSEYVRKYKEIPEGTSVEEIIKAVSRIERMLISRSEALDFLISHCPAFHKQWKEVRITEEARLNKRGQAGG